MDGLPAAEDAVVCGPVWISPLQMCELRIKGRRVRTSVTLLHMLAFLIKADGRVVPREELDGGSAKRASSSRRVDVQIFRIRRVLGPYGKFLISVPGHGYRVDVFGLSQAR